MANSDYSIEDLYGDINKIDDYFFENQNGRLTVQRKHGSIHEYCHYGNNSGQGKCDGYFQMASSGVIHLLKKLKNTHRLEYDKLAEYAILWLSYKLNIFQKTKGTKLNDFYTKYIKTNNDYNKKIKDNDSDSLTYMEIIDRNKDLMNIKEISKFNNPFHILIYLYSMVYDEIALCNHYLPYAKTFANEFEKLNKDSNNIEKSLYNRMLSTLSYDYNKLKNIYGNKKCTGFPSLPELTPQKMDAQPTALSSDVISSSSSISTTLIPSLSIFSIIPVFLGISYKYSLFGVDKLFQRQYIRKKLKKVKKKLKLNI
ncbi:PIR protein CIR protein [Plasmodium vinckei brucechwatti]|uniref:PIR protein CIR protein n=1 Tax=Plasmodium vinckei brucechwatti TaxID=119398 RepID=A0A6V7T277_PLAVN|nr:PIR protein CIR protein [Plasmodium vinckei brucechwatti]